MKHIATFILCFVLVWATPLEKSPLKEVPTKDIDSRISNGDLGGLGQFPWQAALYADSGSTTHFRCSGSIISEQWILTSASCIYGYDTFTVLVGVVDLNGSGVLAQSSEIISHYDYDPNNFLYYNIGLVQLSTLLIFNRYVAAITLAEKFIERGTNKGHRF
jgi:secreted trypsin-like serine protease